MKIIFTFLFLGSLIVNGQSLYFSSKAFELGKVPSTAESVTEFTTDENIYGLLILDEEYPSKFNVDDRFFYGVETTIKVFGKTKLIDESLVHVHEGKTFIYYDILPTEKDAKSPDCMTWTRNVIYLTGKIKVEFVSIKGREGRSSLAETLLNSSIKIKNRRPKSDFDYIRDVRERLRKQYYEEAKSLKQKSDSKQDELNKENESLIDEFKKDDSAPLMGLTDQEVANFLVSKNFVSGDEKIKWINYPTNWDVFSTEKSGLNYRVATLRAVLIDESGSCFYQNVYIKQREVSKGKYGAVFLDPNKAGRRNYYNCSKE